MKIMKKVVSFMLALCLVAGLMAIPAADVSAATAKATVPAKVRILPGDFDSSMSVKYANSGDNIKNIKTSDGLSAKQTDQYTTSSVTGAAQISLYAAKAGTYKLKFDIYSKDGKTKRSSHTVTVYAKSDSPTKSVKFADSTKYWNQLTTKKTGKISVSMNKGYTLKKIQMITHDKSGEEVTKTVKNNSTIALGLYEYSGDRSYDDTSGFCDNWYDYMFAETRIAITYIDKYTKLSETTFYIIYRTSK